MNLICWLIDHDWGYWDRRSSRIYCWRCDAAPYGDTTLPEWWLNFYRFALAPRAKRLWTWARSRKCWVPGHTWLPTSQVCQLCGMTGEEVAESSEWTLPEWKKLWRKWLTDLPRRIFGGPEDLQAGKWYLAGPMSGIPQFNIPAFDAAAKLLRAAGFKVISPAELDAPEIRAQYLKSMDGASIPEMPTWGTFLSRDVKIVADEVGGVVLLPGWEKSRGARLEAYVGLLCGHQFLTVAQNSVKSVRPIWVKLKLWEHL